jgi:hypothetical protein
MNYFKLFTEAVVMRLAKRANRKKASRFKLKTVSMGKARVCLHDREALYGCMEAEKSRLHGDISSS